MSMKGSTRVIPGMTTDFCKMCGYNHPAPVNDKCPNYLSGRALVKPPGFKAGSVITITDVDQKKFVDDLLVFLNSSPKKAEFIDIAVKLMNVLR